MDNGSKVSQITAEIDRLAKQIEELNEVASNIVSRIDKVLEPQRPTIDDTAKSAVEVGSDSSWLRAEIESARRRLQAITERLRDADSRCEI